MQFCLSSPERKLDSSRNNVMRGKILSPHNIRMKLSIGVMLPPHHSGPCDGEGGGGLSGPGVCVILAVCQSGVGNGHRVITAALTASSISLYRCLSLSPPSHSIFLTPGTEERKTDWVTEHHTRNAEWNRVTTEWWCSGDWFYTFGCCMHVKNDHFCCLFWGQVECISHAVQTFGLFE